MTTARWYAKADAYAAGWRAVFNREPSVTNVILGLSVAQHETKCGDAWPGEHNWGAVQKRKLTVAEKKALADAHVLAGPKAVEAARAAIRDAGLPVVDEALHADSSPITGWYFIYFWAFADDLGGAERFVKVLAENRASCRGVLEDAQGTEFALSSAMYRSKYYEGFHDPAAPGGKEANIGDYTRALLRITPEIRTALAAWSPGATPPLVEPALLDLSTVRLQQARLNELGASPPLVVDGVKGPKTIAAIMAFQKLKGLAIDGHIGPRTLAAMRA